MPNKAFTSISFTDLFMEFQYRKERDLDGDGKYEIITQTFKNIGNHNYWLFNLYNIKNNELVNVNYKANYPIMVQILNDDNYNITKRISRSQMKEFALKVPDDYVKK
jgi:hypothetical protein